LFTRLAKINFFMKIFDFLGFIKDKINLKLFVLFLFFIMLPNILRQVIYYITSLKTGSIDFIVSFETVAIYNSFPFIGIIEELLIGVVFTILWFKFEKLRFFAYAWITDALFDFVSVVIWFFLGMTPLQMLGFGALTRFLLREVFLFYGICGPLLYMSKINIRKLSLVYTIIGLIFLALIIIL